MDDFDFGLDLDLGSARRPTEWIAVASPLVYRPKSNPQKRNNGQRRAANSKAHLSQLQAAEVTPEQPHAAPSTASPYSGMPSSSHGAGPDGVPRGTKAEGAGATRVVSSGTLLARAEEEEKRCMGASLQWFTPECDEGNVEYKLRLKDPPPSRFQQLVTQMKFRLSEGSGECFYYIGVEDDGYPRGLGEAELEASLGMLTRMAREVRAEATMVRRLPGSRCRTCALVRVHRLCVDEVTYADLRVAVAGGVDAGKSTLVAVLARGGRGRAALDDGRGAARMAGFRHKHEIESGRTSSLCQTLLGYSAAGRVLNYGGAAAATPAQLAASASKVLRFVDLGGLEKFLKTALYGLTCLAPNYTLLCVAPGGSGGGLPRTTHEHAAAALALEVPLALVLTQVDIAPPEWEDEAVADVCSMLEVAVEGAHACLPAPLGAAHGRVVMPRIASEAQAARAAGGMVGVSVAAVRGGAPFMVPVFAVSSVTGAGLMLLHAFLARLPPSAGQHAHAGPRAAGAKPEAAAQQDRAPCAGDVPVAAQAMWGWDAAAQGDLGAGFETQSTPAETAAAAGEQRTGEAYGGHGRGSAGISIDSAALPSAGQAPPSVHFQVDHTYDVTGVGSVVSGTLLAGRIGLGHRLLLGPTASGGFAAVAVTCIQRAQLPVRGICAGQHATLAIHPVAAQSDSKVVLAERGTCSLNGARSASLPNPVSPTAVSVKAVEDARQKAPGGALLPSCDELSVRTTSLDRPCDGRHTSAAAVLCGQPTGGAESVPQRVQDAQAAEPGAREAAPARMTASRPWLPIGKTDRPAAPEQHAATGVAPLAAEAYRNLASCDAQPSDGALDGSKAATPVREPGGLSAALRRSAEGAVGPSGSAVAVGNLAPPGNSRKGMVLLDVGAEPRTVWRFEAVLVLMSGFWPPRGLLSGRWPPDAHAPATSPPHTPASPAAGWAAAALERRSPSPQSDASDSCSGASGDCERRQLPPPSSRRRVGGGYIPVIHCGSVRQAARVVAMEEIPLQRALQLGVAASVLVAGAATAAMLQEGGAARAQQGASPPRGAASPPSEPHLRPCAGSPGPWPARGCFSSDGKAGGTEVASPSTAACWDPDDAAAALRGRASVSGHGRLGENAGHDMGPGCVARVHMEFCHRAEWLQSGARLLVSSHGGMAGAGVILRLT